MSIYSISPWWFLPRDASLTLAMFPNGTLSHPSGTPSYLGVLVAGEAEADEPFLVELPAACSSNRIRRRLFSIRSS